MKSALWDLAQCKVAIRTKCFVTTSQCQVQESRLFNHIYSLKLRIVILSLILTHPLFKVFIDWRYTILSPKWILNLSYTIIV
jgi:hypothetical protein